MIVFAIAIQMTIQHFLAQNPSRVSSNVIDVIRPILSFLFFFYEEILHTKKSIKSTQASSTQIFILKRKQATFCPDISIRLKSIETNKRLSLIKCIKM